jgi:TIR domain
MGTANLNVFVSYSHADRGWLKVLDPHLKPLAWDGRLDLWDDRRIKAGRLWREEIRAALERADVAILLLSPNYFASDFIASNELPPLLEAAHHRGLQILGLHIAHSFFDGDHVLSSYQTVNRPSEPLDSLRKPKRDVVLVGLARQVREFAQRPKKPPERSEGMSQRRRPDSRADTSGSSDQTYFPYLEQFTPNLRSASSESHLRIFDYSYAPIGRYNWRYEVKSSEALLSDWFHEEHGALVELQDEWGGLLGKRFIYGRANMDLSMYGAIPTSRECTRS